MLDDGSVAIDQSGPATENEWQRVHAKLRGIAKTRGELDAREATYLADAEQLRLWRHFGYSTLLEYMERELGYSPREANERLRIARRLEHLPEMHARLARGTLRLSAVRELARVATPETEGAWLKRAEGKNLRQIEEMVAGHKPGDLPDDPTDPDLRLRPVTFELPPRVYALFREVRSTLANERGTAITDAEVFEEMCRRALAPSGGGETKPAHQIAITTCDQCKRGWQTGAGREIEVDAATIECAQCDAEFLGRLDADTPARVKPTVSPRRRRQVFARDHARCTVPGCRASRNLHIHHLVFRANGGSHKLSNLTLLCSGHHQLMHDRILTISGTAPDKLHFDFRRRSVDGPEPAAIAEAQAALVGLGFGAKAAREAVEIAWPHVGHEGALEALIREALVACRPPRPG